MKNFYSLLILVISLVITNHSHAQTIWDGPIMTFTKANFADWTQEANQDRITSNVWITRADTQGIFNIFTENDYEDNFSPEDTEWAIGTTADIGTLTFDNWEDTSGSNPPSLVNQNMVLHLITDNIYIDLKFTSWTTGQGGGGGGFSYERSTDPSLSNIDFKLDNKLYLYPNPSSDYVQVVGLTELENYSIYNILGSLVTNGKVSENESIEIKELTKGIYFLQFENGNILKFLKE